MKTIQGSSRHQMEFISLDDQVAVEDPVRIVDAFVEKLDLKRLGIERRGGGQRVSIGNAGGAPCFDDKLLMKLYLYGYLN